MNDKVFSFTSEVIIIDEEKKATVYPVVVAKRMAYDVGLDLVEISKSKGKSVCKIMDRGKWIYDQKKAKKGNKQHIPETKEVRFRPSTDDRDIGIKVEHIKRFLNNKHNVRITVVMKGREKAFREVAYLKLTQVMERIDMGKADKTQSGPETVSVMIHADGNSISNER